MQNYVPHELEICFYLHGQGEAYPEFVIQLPNGYEPVPYKEIGCDDDGVFLATDDGQVTRIRPEQGIECYEQTEGMAAVHLHLLDSTGESHSEFEVVRLDRESALAYGG